MRLKYLPVLIVIIVSIAFLASFGLTKAAISGCTASVTPTDNQPNVQSQYNFTITNNDSSVNVVWFRIYKPHNETTLQGYSIYPAWFVDVATETYTFRASANPLMPGKSISPSITLSIGDIPGANSDWVVQVSDNSGGANPTTCTGSLIFTVTGQTDITAPLISGVSVSNITSSSAVVIWTTNELSTSVVQYDVNPEEQIYPFSASSSQMVLLHSLTITQSIAAGTTYYYRVCSTDPSGNQGCSSENSFTTTAVGAATSTPAPTVTKGPTPTVGPSPTPTPVIDRTPPRVTITTDLAGSFENAPEITGRATDNEEVAKIDYSTDGGKNWLPVDFIEEPNSTATEFSFTPFIFDDGNYEIVARATDANGNTGTSDTVTLVLDRLPPRVGGNLISLGPQPLLPNEDGVIVTMAGLDLKVTLSAVGGPIEVDLYVDEEKFSLKHSEETGLWSGYINLSQTGLYQLSTKATDGAGNVTERKLNSILVVPAGKITGENGKAVKSGTVNLYVQDPLSLIWALWDGEPFGQSNPQKIEDGRYQYYLPPGTYYLTINSPGYALTTSQIFKLEKSTPFNADFVLKTGGEIDFGFFKLPLPGILSEKVLVKIKTTSYTKRDVSEFLGDEFPDFELPTIGGDRFETGDIRGDISVVSFVATWSPPALEQISILDKAISDQAFKAEIISSQETTSRIKVFAKRGKYNADIIVDRDGELFEELGINSLPTHFFLDRKGTVKKVITGVLSEGELQGILSEI